MVKIVDETKVGRGSELTGSVLKNQPGSNQSFYRTSERGTICWMVVDRANGTVDIRGEDGETLLLIDTIHRKLLFDNKDTLELTDIALHKAQAAQETAERALEAASSAQQTADNAHVCINKIRNLSEESAICGRIEAAIGSATDAHGRINDVRDQMEAALGSASDAHKRITENTNEIEKTKRSMSLANSELKALIDETKQQLGAAQEKLDTILSGRITIANNVAVASHCGHYIKVGNLVLGQLSVTFNLPITPHSTQTLQIWLPKQHSGSTPIVSVDSNWSLLESGFTTNSASIKIKGNNTAPTIQITFSYETSN